MKITLYCKKCGSKNIKGLPCGCIWCFECCINLGECKAIKQFKDLLIKEDKDNRFDFDKRKELLEDD